MIIKNIENVLQVKYVVSLLTFLILVKIVFALVSGRITHSYYFPESSDYFDSSDFNESSDYYESSNYNQLSDYYELSDNYDLSDYYESSDYYELSDYYESSDYYASSDYNAFSNYYEPSYYYDSTEYITKSFNSKSQAWHVATDCEFVHIQSSQFSISAINGEFVTIDNCHYYENGRNEDSRSTVDQVVVGNFTVLLHSPTEQCLNSWSPEIVCSWPSLDRYFFDLKWMCTNNSKVACAATPGETIRALAIIINRFLCLTIN